MRMGNPWKAAAVVLLLVLAAAALRHHYAHQRALGVGDRLVPLSFDSLTGGTVTIAPSGRPQVINVFATWCGPCRFETPRFAHLADELLARGVSVIGLDQQEPPAAVERFRAEFSLRYPVYIDNGDVTHAVLGARMIPETLYVDAGGTIRWIREGPLSAAEIRNYPRDRRGSRMKRAVVVGFDYFAKFLADLDQRAFVFVAPHRIRQFARRDDARALCTASSRRV